MRTARERIIHALLFELIAVLTITPLGALLFGIPMHDFGVLAIVSTALAVIWTYVFNLGFDHAMHWHLKTTAKSWPVRVLHAVLFEAGLMLLFVPVIVWFLDITFWQAFTIDLSMSGFYLVYAFAFNWIYDIAVPVQERDKTA